MTMPPSDDLSQAAAALRDGQIDKARQLLAAHLRQNLNSVRGWWLMSFAAPDVQLQIECLQRVLQLSPENALASERLAKLTDAATSGAASPAPAGPAIPARPAPTSTAPAARVHPTEPPVEGPSAARQAESQPASRSGSMPRPAVRPPAKKQPGWARPAVLLALLVLLGACVIVGGYFGSQVVQSWRVESALRAAQQQGTALALQIIPTSTYSIQLPPTWTPTVTPSLTPTRTPTPTATETATPESSLTPTSIPASAYAPRVGAYAPDFQLTASNSGESVLLSQLRGQPVLIVFWAGWCDYCRREMPSAQAVYDRYAADGLVILGVGGGESTRTAKSYAQELDLAFGVLADPQRTVEKLYQVTAYPTNFFVSKTGKIVAQVIGYMEEAEITLQVKNLLR